MKTRKEKISSEISFPWPRDKCPNCPILKNSMPPGQNAVEALVEAAVEAVAEADAEAEAEVVEAKVEAGAWR